MKSNFLKLGIFTFLIIGFQSLYSQDLEVKIVKADSIITPGGKCTVEVSVSGGVAPYSFMLYDNEPWEGGNLLEKSSVTNEMTHSFTIVSAGRYLVAVRDKNNFTKIIIVQIHVAATASVIHLSSVTRKHYMM